MSPMPGAQSTPDKPSPKRLTVRQHLLLAALALLILTPGIFRVSLFDRDEGWYAQVSREMLQSGDWLVPHYLGEPWLAKPPLLYWCVAASFGRFGIHEWAGRLVSVLAMVGAVQLLALVAAHWFNRRTAWFAAVSFACAGLPAVVGRMVLTDALLLLWCMAAALLLARFAAGQGSWRSAALLWITLGLGVLTKGPAIAPFTGALILGLAALHGGRWLRRRELWLMFPLLLVIALPWYLAVAQTAGDVLRAQLLGEEILHRFTKPPHGHVGPPGYHLAVALAGWLPWTVLVPGAVFEAWRDRRRDRQLWVLLIWWALPWLFLELVPSKLPHYALPAYAPLAIMLGRMWDRGLDAQVTHGQRLVLHAWAIVPALLGVGLLIAAVRWREHAAAQPLLAAALVLLMGFAVVLAWVRQGRLCRAWLAAVTATALLYVTLGAWLLPRLEPHRLSRRIAAAANSLAAADADVLVCGYDEPSLFFYLEGKAEVVPRETLRIALLKEAPPALLIIRAGDLEHAVGIALQEVPSAQSIDGFNYVKGRHERVWLARGDEASEVMTGGR